MRLLYKVRRFVERIYYRISWNGEVLWEVLKGQRDHPIWIQDLKIITEQPKGLLIVSKAPDLLINHESKWKKPVTLANQIYYHRAEKADHGLKHRYRFCHQIDYATSGVICLAYTSSIAGFAASCFQKRTAGKQYLALLWGHVTDCLKNKQSQEVINTLIDSQTLAPNSYAQIHMDLGSKLVMWSSGRQQKIQGPITDPEINKTRFARTDLIVLSEGTYAGMPASKVLFLPQTGRQHQLRVHSSVIGHGVVGDSLYGGRDQNKYSRMMLHAYRLKLPFKNNGVNVCAEDPFTIDLDSLWQPVTVLNDLESLNETFCIGVKMTKGH